jgi:anti-anti-sigma factor
VLRITDESVSDGHRIVLKGDVDMATAPILDEHVDGLVRDGRHRLEIDLAHVQFLDSKGLASLISTRRKLQGEGRSLVLSGVDASLMRVFEVTGLVRYFEFA